MVHGNWSLMEGASHGLYTLILSFQRLAFNLRLGTGHVAVCPATDSLYRVEVLHNARVFVIGTLEDGCIEARIFLVVIEIVRVVVIV